MLINVTIFAKADSVDSCMNDLVKIDEYDDVKDYIIEKFGNIEGEKWIEYPETNKWVYLLVNEEKIEFCALKKEKQYFGKGWKLINKDK